MLAKISFLFSHFDGIDLRATSSWRSAGSQETPEVLIGDASRLYAGFQTVLQSVEPKLYLPQELSAVQTRMKMAIHPTDLVTASSPAEGVRLIALNRPQKRNALSQELIKQLLKALSDASHDAAVHAIVITGNGDLFCGMSRTLLQVFGRRLTNCSWC